MNRGFVLTAARKARSILASCVLSPLVVVVPLAAASAGCSATVSSAKAPTSASTAKAPAATPAAPAPDASVAAKPADEKAPADDAADESEEGGDAADGEDSADNGKGGDPEDMDEFDGTVLDMHDPSKTTAPTHPKAVGKSPLENVGSDELKRMVREDMEALGPLSLGAPNRGRLVNGVQMPKGDHWTITDPAHCWGTQETVDNITVAVEKVNKQYDGTPKIVIGHISAKNGGHLSPHKSHQAGRDVDIGYYYSNGSPWYTRATEDNLDKARTWAFVKAVIQDTPVEMIFIDTSIQRILKDYAASVGEDKKWLDEIFQVGGQSANPIIRHVAGHATHIHVRFFSPIAQASARIIAPYLPRRDQPVDEKGGSEGIASSGHGHGQTVKIEYVLHRARSGDTLDSLARHYGVSVQDIKDANNISGSKLKQKTTYRIPKKVVVTSKPEHSKPEHSKPSNKPPKTKPHTGSTAKHTANP